jgi:hypothetical protein
VTSPLVNPIAEALYDSPRFSCGCCATYDDLVCPEHGHPYNSTEALDADCWCDLPDRGVLLAEDATAAVIAVVAALPHDYTAVDVLAFLRGDAGDPPEYEPEDEAPAVGPIPLVAVGDTVARTSWVNAVVRTLNEIHAATTKGEK